ncbi:hypothetical protein BDV96DRAFT_643750 [Lophiotrema nucula]|uniref:Transcription factor domain-containing protein n=1 Tax=Lophiotrema nucula TaxID=690887 RepID=A0A6A5ZHF0_9PLEO|nr:hypothetical protein BDV96DRAFT_643750 [Lophiotrema nucula]
MQAIRTLRLQPVSELPQSSLPTHNWITSSLEASLYEFFHVVCAKDFSLYFENNFWEPILLRTAQTEPSIYHAALAISALSRRSYFPIQDWHDSVWRTPSATQYSILQYNLAIQHLNARLDGSAESVWLAVLASIIFIQIQHLQDDFSLASVHLRGGLSLLPGLGSGSRDAGSFEDALCQIQNELAIMEGM